MIKPPGHCPGGFSHFMPLVSAGGALFALPMWRGFLSAFRCKALSGFLSGFYSNYINSHLHAFSKQTATPQPPRNAARLFYEMRGGFRGRLCPVSGFGCAARPPAISAPWRSACRLWCFPRRQGSAAPAAARRPTVRPRPPIRFPTRFLHRPRKFPK